MNCQKCGASLALADERCQACGCEAPKAARAGIFLKKAFAAFEGDRLEDAIRYQEKALALAEGSALLDALRTHGSWAKRAAEAGGLERAGWLDKAANSLAQARDLQDSDETLHHLWIDLMVERGNAPAVASHYQNRLKDDPSDERSTRMLKVLRLALDFKAAPPKVVLDLGPPSRIESWFLPSRVKVASLGVWAVGSLGIALLMWLNGGGPSAAEMAADPSFDPSGASISLILSNPMTWFWDGMIPLGLLSVMAWMRR